jgi:hemerythrin-like domain-containing protein
MHRANGANGNLANPDQSYGAPVGTETAKLHSMNRKSISRRGFLSAGAMTGSLAICGAAANAAGPSEQKSGETEKEEVSPAGDLMREHGILKRILLVYGEAVRRIDDGQECPPDPVLDSAKLVRSFVEDYHEKLEEDFLFPRFRKANQFVDLVDVLAGQHQAGRRLTDITLRHANLNALRAADSKRELRDSMAQFIRMYSPHEAREDTVLFPALHKIISGHEYGALGEEFEKKEEKLFGEDGFEKMVKQVEGIEKSLGIYELSQFTPR